MLEDTLDENDETLTVTGNVRNLNSLNLNGRLTVTGDTFTIRDNDSAPTGIGLSVTGDDIVEGGSTASLTVRATLQGGGTRLEETRLVVTLTGITATAGIDYRLGGDLAVIAIPAGSFHGEAMVTIIPLQDTLYEGDETVAVRGINVDPGLPINGVLLTVQDDDPAPTTITLSVDPGTLSESVGSTLAKVTATLDGSSTLTGDTQIRLRLNGGESARRAPLNGQLVVPAGQRTASSQVLLTDLNDDVDDADETLELGGTADNPDLTVKAAQLIITDDDTAGITIAPVSLVVREGGPSQTYSVKVDSQPTSNVTVTVELPANVGFSVFPGTLTFTSASWGPQSVTVTATQDDDAVDEPAKSISHSVSSTDEQYRSVTAPGVSVAVRDDETATVTVSKSSLTIEEGASDTYTVVLDAQPAGDVTVTIGGNTDTDVSLSATTLTFTDQSWNTAQTVTVTAEHDTDTLDEDAVRLTHSVASAADTDYDGIAAGSVSVSVTDDDDDGVNISKDSLALEEGESDTYTVALGSQPAGDVTVTIGGNTDTDVSLSATTLTFTDQSWATAQTVTVTAEHDTDTLNEDDVTLTHTVASAADTGYDGIAAGSVAVSVTDDDDDGVNISAASLTLEEGESDTYTVALGSQPAGDVTVTIGGNTDTDVSLSATTLTFTDQSWGTAQTVTVTAGEDSDAVDEDDVTLTHTVASAADTTYDGIAAGTVAVSVTDDDRVGVTVDESELTLEEGEADTYTVALTSQPAGDVTVTIGGNTDTDVSLSETTLTFTDQTWATAQTVTVTAEHDGDAVDEDDVTLTHTVASAADATYDGIAAGRVTVKVTDDDHVGVTIDELELTLEEGESDTYTVVLGSQPSGDVTVTIGGNTDTDVSLSETTLTFTDQSWATAQTVTVTAEHDGDAVDEDDVTLTHTVASATDATYDGIAAGTVMVSVTDDDRIGVTVSESGLTIEEGETDSYTVVLGSQPVGDVTVTIGGSTDTDVSLSATTLTFTDQNWETAQTVTVTAEDDGDAVDEDDVTLTHTVASAADASYDGIAAGSVTVSVTDDDEDGVTVRPTTVTVPEGHAVHYTVVLDAQPTGSVTVTINDPADNSDVTAAPASLTFTDQNWNTAQFVTVTATADSDEDEDSATITHTVSGYGSATTADDVAVTVTEETLVDVEVSYGQARYDVEEGESVTIKAVLDVDPERTLTIPLSPTEDKGATSDDYSGVPDYLTFGPGETEKEFTFTAVDDSVDDDDERVWVGFGALPEGVGVVVPRRARVEIGDNDIPETVTVSFEHATYEVSEGDQINFKVKLSDAPERSFSIPFVWVAHGGATLDDLGSLYADYPVHGNAEEVTIPQQIAQDDIDDDGESFKVSFGELPDGVIAGTPSEAVVTILDDDEAGVTVSPTNLPVTEGGHGEYTVKLNSRPTQEVTVTIGGIAGTDLSLNSSSLTFTTSSWNAALTVTVTAGQDSDVDDDSAILTHTVTSSDSLYEGIETDGVEVSVADDDARAVIVSFGTARYTVAESDDASTTENKENEIVVTVTLSADPERTVTIPIDKTEQGGASSADYSGVPANVTFQSGDTAKSFMFTATADTVDDDDESVKLTFGDLPTGVSQGATSETVISITDDDDPAVTVSYGTATYTVAESDDTDTTGVTENEVVVTVSLSADPERTVTIPINKTEQGGASSADYSGVPANVTFQSGDTAKSFTFSATADTVDDDGESVKLTFGDLPTGITEGATKQTVVSITDDDDPAVQVSFGSATYTVAESDDTSTTEAKENEVVVAVSLSADPERTVTIPINKTEQGGASSADYSGVPANVTFQSGDTAKSFTFSATADTVDDDDESVKLTFGNLPTGVTEGTTKETVVAITDDDDPAVQVSFGAARYTVAESDVVDTSEDSENEVVVTVRLSADPERTVTVPIEKAEQGGATSADYTGVPANVTFQSGDTARSFTFTATADTVDDDDESVKLTFGNLPTGVTEGTTKETVIAIADDDDPAVQVSYGANRYSVAESDDTETTGAKENEVVVTVTLSADPERTVTIPIDKTEQGGATSADYAGVPANVTFQSGDTAKSFTFRATADTVDDDDESVKLTFGNLPTGVSEGSTNETVVSITDDDKPASVTVNFGESGYTAAEGGTVTITVTLSDDPEMTVTIPINKTEEDGASSADYSGVPANVTFQSGDTAKSFTFSATADTVDDDEESVKLTFGNLPTGVTEGTTKEAVVSITDDDDPTVTVSYGTATYTVAESDDTTTAEVTENEVVVTVSLSADPERTVTIPIDKVEQGGASSADYTGVPANLTFQSGDTAKSFTFSATADTVDDDGESVKLTFGNLPTGVTEGTTKETVVAITDDDAPAVQVSFGSATYTAAESDDTSTTEVTENEVVVTVSLSADPERTVTIPIDKTEQGGASSADYSGVPANLTFQSGDTAKSFTFTATADTVDDDDESVKLTFGDLPSGVSEGATKEAVVAITDDDDPAVSVSFGANRYSVAESDDTSTTEATENEVVVTVSLSADPERTVTIPIDKTEQGGATSADYSGVPANVTFQSGDTAKSFTFSATADTVDDDDESVKLTFGDLPTGVTEGTTKEAVVSITDDDDPAVQVSFGSATYTVAESDDTSTTEATENEVVVTVSLSADPERTVTIPIDKTEQGGATSADYSGVPANVTFQSGDTAKSFTFSATADTVDDDDESVKLTFGNLPTGVSEGTTKESVVSITDDDVPSVTVNFKQGRYTVGEGSSVTVTVELGAAPERTVVINLITTNQGGATDSDYSGVPASITFGSEETAKSFTVSAVRDNLDDSGESVKLSFNTLPSQVAAGTTSETTINIANASAQSSLEVNFGAAAYGLSEGATTSIKVTLNVAPGSEVVIPLVKSEQGGATSADYSGVPAGLTFGSTDTEQAFTFTATQDTVDDDGESVKLTFDTLPAGVSEGTTKETVVAITDDDDPAVTVSYGAARYTVAESDDASTTEAKENEVVVTVSLSADPERTVTIPINKTEQGGASSADYSGIPTNVTFQSGDTAKSFTFTATADTVDDDDESVKLTFDTLPAGVSEGTTKETVVAIADDDDPAVQVSFGSARYTVAETDDASTTEATENEVVVTVTLSADPERTVTISINKTEQGGATSADYSGVPANVTFQSGDTAKSFTFTATADTVDDDDESVKLTFGNLPTGVSEGSTNETVVSITDDDKPASVTVNFGESGYTVAESDDTSTTEAKENEVVVTVTLNDDPEMTVTIPINKTEQDGASSADYSGVPANVTFQSGDTAKSFTFSATADTVDDDNESVKLTFGNLPTGVTEGTTKETVVAITDDDDPAVTVSYGTATYTVAESDDTDTTGAKENEVVVAVTLSADPERTVTIPINKTEQGGATSADYSGVPANITFQSGDTAKSFTFTATADTVDDDDEAVKLTFGDLPTGVTEGTTKEAVVSITDDDDPAVQVSFGSATYTVAESDDTSTKEVTENEVVVTVTLSADPERTVTISINKTEQGGATSADYSGVPANVTFQSGDTAKSFTFTATADTVDDDDESVKLTFGNLPPGVSEGTTQATVVSITDDDLPTDVKVAFGQGAYTAAESDDTSTTEVKENETVVTLTLSEDPERTVTIPIDKTEQGGATSADYSGVPANVTFQSGDTAKSFTFSATADTVDDDDESVKLTFGDLPTGVTEGTTKEAVLSITDDDDPAVMVSFGSARNTVAESDDTSTTEAKENEVVVTVSLSADPERTVTIPIDKTEQGGASSSDYSGVPANVTFQSGDTAKTFTFTATADTVDDDNESVKLTFGNLPTGVTEGTTKATVVSITDDDDPAVTVSYWAATYTVAESDDASTTEDKENEVVVTVTLSADPERTVTIPINKTEQGGATSADYSGVPANLTFQSGDTAKSFTFSATADTEDDDDESVKLTFGNLPTGVSEGTTKETVVSITDDDDPAVTVSYGAATYSVTEGGSVVVKVKLSADPERSVTVSITKTNSSGTDANDYSGVPENVTFTGGETEKSFTFAATQDQDDEDSEQVTLGFDSYPAGVSAGSPAEATVTISDSLRVSFGATSYEAHEGGDGADVVVQLDAQAPVQIVVPITADGMNGATSGDWTGAPRDVTFEVGDLSKTFTITAYDDDVEDGGEAVQLGFGNLGSGIVEGSPATSTVQLMNSEIAMIASECELPSGNARVIDDWWFKVADMNIYLGYHPYDELGWKGPRRGASDVTCFAVERRVKGKSDDSFGPWQPYAAVLDPPPPSGWTHLNIGTNNSCEVIQFRVRAVFKGKQYGPWGVLEWNVCRNSVRLIGEWY